MHGAGGQCGQEDHQEHQRAGPDLDEEPLAVQLAAAVDPGEGAEGRKNRQVQAAQQQQGDQRHEHAHGTPRGNMMVLVCRGKGEHLGQQLHGGIAPFVAVWN